MWQGNTVVSNVSENLCAGAGERPPTPIPRPILHCVQPTIHFSLAVPGLPGE